MNKTDSVICIYKNNKKKKAVFLKYLYFLNFFNNLENNNFL